MKLSADFINHVSNKYDIDISEYDMDQLRKGYKVELEHDSEKKPSIDVVKTLADPLKIAIAHLDELPDYYDRLEKMEKGEIEERILRKVIREQINMMVNKRSSKKPMNEFSMHTTNNPQKVEKLFRSIVKNNRPKRVDSITIDPEVAKTALEISDHLNISQDDFFSRPLLSIIGVATKYV